MADYSFKEFVLDQLAEVPDVRIRAMFGGAGVYSGDHFFAILDEGRLFFKTDDKSKADYLDRGMGPFTYSAQGKKMTMAYHEVPPEILENAPELVTWARRAIKMAMDKKAKPKRPIRKRKKA
jgi:DNA transformation protein